MLTRASVTSPGSDGLGNAKTVQKMNRKKDKLYTSTICPEDQPQVLSLFLNQSQGPC